MEWWAWLWIALGFFVFLPLFGMIFIVPPFVYKGVLARKSKETWSRNKPSDPKNADILQMWKESKEFEAEFQTQEEDVHVVSEDGLNLYGEYYDCGSDTAVILLPGRPETCIYSLYYGKSYWKAGVNVLAIDTRAHGLSDGYWHGCGYQERLDVFAFAKWLEEEKGIKKIVLHGVCVGSSTAIHSVTDPKTPKSIIGLVTDGAYLDFYEMMWRRIRYEGKIYPWPAILYFQWKIKKLYDYDIKKDGPVYRMKDIHIPTLMIASKEDKFSLPKNTELLYSKLPKDTPKKLVWWEHGAHSHLRAKDSEKYDEVIGEFVESLKKD